MRLRTITSAAPLRESLFTGRAQVGARASLYRPAATAAANCVFVGGRRGYAASAGALPTEATVARYREYGNPHNVLKVEKEPLPAKLKEGEILLAMLCAPVNPADLNMVEGVYPTRPTVPAVGGNEGVAEVLAVGPGVQGIAVNDWVIPKKPGFGTWRTHAVCSQQQVTKVKQNIKPEYIATLAVNPCTALRLLEDFVQLKEGDTVIQNGANSAVGQAFMQLANLRGVKTINIVRKRENWDQLVERMKGYGAYIVVPPENLGTAQFQRLISDLPKPKLALNCVGGPTATEMVRVLDKDGVMVTYGGMSRKPVQVPTSALIFKNISLKGFWLSRWLEEHSEEDRMAMMNQLWDLIKSKKLRLWMERHSFPEDFASALQRATEEHKDRKVVLHMKHYNLVQPLYPDN